MVLTSFIDFNWYVYPRSFVIDVLLKVVTVFSHIRHSLHVVDVGKIHLVQIQRSVVFIMFDSLFGSVMQILYERLLI